MRKGLSVVESGNTKGVLQELIDSRCVFQINWRNGCVCIASLAQSWLWEFIETASKPPHKPITKSYALYAGNSLSHTLSANSIWFQGHFPQEELELSLDLLPPPPNFLFCFIFASPFSEPTRALAVPHLLHSLHAAVHLLAENSLADTSHSFH